MLSLAMPGESESESDDDDDDDDDAAEQAAPTGLLRGLSLKELDTGYDEESPPGGKRNRSEKPALKKQSSFDVTPTMTVEMGDLRIKPEGIVSSPRGKGNQMKTNLNLRVNLENVKLLGKGATSKVFLAKHATTGQLYAVKELMAMADEDTRHMAVNEIKIANKHAAHAEHLVKTVDAYFHKDKICIAMEFADAGSFEDVINRSEGGVPPVPLGAITLQMMNGLQYLHREMHQVHRDLKPANVMLTMKGVAKLSDFGISKQLESTGAFAMTQVGTISYMAPERFGGGMYDFVSDVWSVGIITLEAITGEHPYKAQNGNFIAISMAVCNKPSPVPPEGTPEEIVEFVQQCLIKEHKGVDGRPGVRALTSGIWMKECSRTNAQKETERYLKLQKGLE